jgi:plastocyanin
MYTQWKKIYFFLLLCALSIYFHAAHAATHEVLMTQGGFEPQAVQVSQGDTVIFKNTDVEGRWPASNIHPTHEIYPEFDPKNSIAPGQSWQFTFEKTGNWKYHDHLKPTLSGTVTVTAKQAETPAPEGFWAKLWRAISTWWRHLWHKDITRTSAKPTTSSFDKNIPNDDESIFSDEKRLASYMHKYGPKETIAALHALEGKFGSCHQSAHRAGHIGYEQLGEKALIEYSPECQSGYYHGVMEAYFKDHGTNNLAESLTNLCPKNLNNFFEHQCIHGIGHGLLAWTNYELPEALTACDQLPRRQDSCWTGAFMENLSAQIATGNKNSSAPAADIHLTKYLKNDDPLYPCDGVDSKYQNSCYFLQTSRMPQML